MRAPAIGFILIGTMAACASQQPANDAASAPPQSASPTPTYTAPAGAQPQPTGAVPASTGTASSPASAQPASTTPTTAAAGSAPSTSAASKLSATVQIGKPSISGAQVANAETIATGMQGDFTRCYSKALETDQSAAGSVLIALQVGKDGAVTRADASPNGNVPPAVQNCIRSRAEGAKFAPPKGGSAIVTFSITLAPSSATAAAGSSTELKEVAVSPPGFEHADKVAQFIRAKARECYRDSLRLDARAEGKVSVALWLDQKGVVTKVEALRTGTLSDGITECIKKRAVPAQFPAPKLAPTVVTVPIKLALKAK